MKYFFIILVLAYSSLYANDYEWQFTHLNNDTVQTAGHSRVSCSDTMSAVVARTKYSYPYSRWIEHTSDYGQTWDTLYYEDLDCESWEVYQYLISDIKYLDENNILAIYGYRNFLQSTDGGKSWIDTSYFDDSFAYNEISSFDSLVIVAGATDQFMGISKDLGKTWTLQEIDLMIDNNREYIDTTIYSPKNYKDTLFTFVHLRHKVPFTSQLTYLLDNIFMFSIDEGKSWQKLYTIDDLALSNCYAIDDNYFYTQSVDYSFDTVLVYKPDGTGLDTTLSPTPHWQMVKINKYSGNIEVMTDSLSFTCGVIIEMNKFDDYLCISTPFKSFYSSDYGDTWIKEEWNSSNKSAGMINDYERLSMSKGFMVGNSKFATLQPSTSVLQKQNAIKNISVYPNPISSGSKLNLEFEAQESGVYSYKLNSLDGKSMQFDRQDYLSTGKAFTTIELGSDFATGVYILSIMKDGEVVAAKKVIVE